MKKAEAKIISWIKKKMADADAKGLILGLSGGLDSAVVAALAKKAAGKNHLVLIMPCYSVKTAIADARLVAKKLRLKSRVVNLNPAFDILSRILPKSNQLARANLKARLRMITLYYFANNLNYMVTGTGNKSELSVGYFTKYGDGGTDILPLGDLLKKEVYELGKVLKIPKRIIEKSPSADLWAGQTDEDEMGITYQELDSILAAICRKRKIKAGKSKLNKVKKMIKNSEHKRNTPEVCKI